MPDPFPAPRIVFMGTPEFAVPSLRALVDAGYAVVGVITATDKRGGRGGKQLLQSPVKQAAEALGLPVLQPKNLKAADFLEALTALQADLQIVVAFRMLPTVVWDMPTLGTFNLHGSLLPRYRGAAPINWAVINGETETGATTFFIQEQIDTGDVLLQHRMPIGENETAGEVHDRMMVQGAELVLATVRLIEGGDYTLRQQDDTAATPAPKLDRELCRIDWDQPARRVHNFIRGLSPWPDAWTTLDRQQLKIIRTEVASTGQATVAGTVGVEDGSLQVACSNGNVRVLELQLAGRKRMAVSDFLRGGHLGAGVVLGQG